MKTKKILFLYNGDRITGALESMLLLMLNLPGPEYEVMVAASNPEILLPRLQGTSIQVFKIPLRSFSIIRETYLLETQKNKIPFKSLLHLFRLFNEISNQKEILIPLIERLQPDIVHINGITLIASGFVTKRYGVPLVWHVRSTLGKNIWGKWAGRWVPRNADAVIAVSKYTASRLTPFKDNVHTIYNAVDVERFSPDISGAPFREELCIPQSTQCVGFFGNLIYTKGIFELLKAAPEIIAAAPDTHFVMVGTGEQATLDQLEQQIQRFPFSDHFHLTGERHDIPEFIAAMDVLVLPTHDEGLSRAVLEAMAMEKPVVTTNIEPHLEVIRSGKNGLLVPPHNPHELANATITFLHDRAFAESCGKTARNDILANFSIEAHISKMTGIYEKISIV
jgi:glycosyltransferase involved in cell wall biosynthesis